MAKHSTELLSTVYTAVCSQQSQCSDDKSINKHDLIIIWKSGLWLIGSITHLSAVTLKIRNLGLYPSTYRICGVSQVMSVQCHHLAKMKTVAINKLGGNYIIFWFTGLKYDINMYD